MNIQSALRESPPPSAGDGWLSRLKTLVAAATDRGATLEATPRPYSFLSECECPEYCLRDHENE